VLPTEKQPSVRDRHIGRQTEPLREMLTTAFQVIRQMVGVAEDPPQARCRSVRGGQEFQREPVRALLTLLYMPRANRAIRSPVHQMNLHAKAHALEGCGQYLLASRWTIAIQHWKDALSKHFDCGQPRKEVVHDEVGDLVGEGKPALRLLIAGVKEHKPPASPCNQTAVKCPIAPGYAVVNTSLQQPTANFLRREARQEFDRHR
jgi:hypothetical protein